MSAPIEIEHLDAIIKRSMDLIDAAASLGARVKDSHYFRDGGCDAFAFALQCFLIAKGEESSLTIISRETYLTEDPFDEDFEGPELIDSNNFSHCTIEAFDTSWDFGGSNANDRWENDWSDSYGNKSEFDYQDADVKKITHIRLEKNESTNTDLVQALNALLHSIDQNKPIANHVNACVSAINGKEFTLFKEPKKFSLSV